MPQPAVEGQPAVPLFAFFFLSSCDWRAVLMIEGRFQRMRGFYQLFFQMVHRIGNWRLIERDNSGMLEGASTGWYACVFDGLVAPGGHTWYVSDALPIQAHPRLTL
jgi:hypothetical protein